MTFWTYRKRNSQIKESSLEHELIQLLDDSIHSRREKQSTTILSINDNVKANLLYSTLSQLIFLLSRKKQNNSLHMHIITYVSEEINHYVSCCHSLKSEELIHQAYLVSNAEQLLVDCYKVMDLAENKAKEYKKLKDRYIFRDEISLIKNYMDKSFINEKAIRI